MILILFFLTMVIGQTYGVYEGCHEYDIDTGICTAPVRFRQQDGSMFHLNQVVREGEACTDPSKYCPLAFVDNGYPAVGRSYCNTVGQYLTKVAFVTSESGVYKAVRSTSGAPSGTEMSDWGPPIYNTRVLTGYVCKLCPAGKISIGTACEACDYDEVSNEARTECLPESTCDNYYGKTHHQKICQCKKGFYNAATYPQYTCEACPPFTASEVGTTSADQCVSCPKGKGVKDGTCVNCQRGEYTSLRSYTDPSTGDQEQSYYCDTCDDGTNVLGIINATGDGCKTCPRGQGAKLSKLELGWSNFCRNCPEGKFSYKMASRWGEDTYVCLNCTEGKYTNQAGQMECTSCPENTYSHSYGAVSDDACVDCPEGYSNKGLGGRFECLACANDTTVTYSPSGAGHCRNIKYLDAGAYPELLNWDEPLYDSYRVQECWNRCSAENGKATGFYTKNVNGELRCACASDACDSTWGGFPYNSYKSNFKSQAQRDYDTGCWRCKGPPGDEEWFPHTSDEGNNIELCADRVVKGCMDTTACNYNIAANVNEGCTYPNKTYPNCERCNRGSISYSISEEGTTAGVCADKVVKGCMNSTACNYNSAANVDEGCIIASRPYPACQKCSGGNKVNKTFSKTDYILQYENYFKDPHNNSYYESLLNKTQMCPEDGVFGCRTYRNPENNLVSCNYNPDANIGIEDNYLSMCVVVSHNCDECNSTGFGFIPGDTDGNDYCDRDEASGCLKTNESDANNGVGYGNYSNGKRITSHDQNKCTFDVFGCMDRAANNYIEGVNKHWYQNGRNESLACRYTDDNLLPLEYLQSRFEQWGYDQTVHSATANSYLDAIRSEAKQYVNCTQLRDEVNTEWEDES